MPPPHEATDWNDPPSIISWQRKKNRRNWEFLEKSHPAILPHSRCRPAAHHKTRRIALAKNPLHGKFLLEGGVYAVVEESISDADSSPADDSGLFGSSIAAISCQTLPSPRPIRQRRAVAQGATSVEVAGQSTQTQSVDARSSGDEAAGEGGSCAACVSSASW